MTIYRFKKPIKTRIPHFACIEDLDDTFDVVVLTTNKEDVTVNENGVAVLQMHKSVYDYHYEVKDDYCDYYTDHCIFVQSVWQEVDHLSLDYIIQ